MGSIYEITNDILTLLDMAEAGEIDQQCFVDTLEGLEGEFDFKIDSWCRAVKNINNDVNGLKEEIKRLSDRKKAKENEVKRMKAALCTVLEARGMEKYKTLNYSLYGMKADKLEIVDTSAVPDELKIEVISKKADEKKIKELLLSGQELEFARLIKSLTIR